MVAKVLVGVCMGVATCSLFLSMALHGSAMPAALSRGLFQVGSVWLVFLLYMVLALLLVDVAVWLRLTVPHGFWIALFLCSMMLISGITATSIRR